MMTAEQLKASILQLAFSGGLIDFPHEYDSNDNAYLNDKRYAIPDSWKWETLGSICDIYTGNSISEAVKKQKYLGLVDGLPYIGTKDVSFQHIIDYNNGVRIPEKDNFKRAFSGAVLMCIEGGSAGRKIAILNRDVCFGNKLCMFFSQTVLNKYIYYYLQSKYFLEDFSDNMAGIIGGVSIKKIKQMMIPVAPKSEQLAIVNKIEELMPYAAEYAMASEKLDKLNTEFSNQIKKSILQMAVEGKLVEQRPEEGTGEELFWKIQEEKAKLIKEGKIKKQKPLADIADEEKPFDIPESWEWVKLGNICKSITDGDHQAPPQTTSGIPFLVISNVSSGKLDFSNTRFVPEEYYKHLPEDRIAIKGDLLFTVTGSYGIPIKVDIDRKFCFQRHIALLKPLGDIDYLLYVLQSPLVTNQCDLMVTGTAQKTLGLSSLRNIIIPFPPLEEQRRIVNKLKEVIPMVFSIHM